MSASATMSAGVGASSHAPAQQETLRFPRNIIRHAGARAAPGSFHLPPDFVVDGAPQKVKAAHALMSR
jgi:hypothetical protein